MTSEQILTRDLVTVEVNENFSEAVLQLHDHSRLCFCHGVDARWAKSVGPQQREDEAGRAGELLAAITMFRLNAKHLDIQFEDGSRWDQPLQNYSVHLTQQQIRQYRELGYVSGPRVLDDEQIGTLKARIQDILEGRVRFPEHLTGQTVDKSSAPGQLPSVKVVNIFRHDDVFAEIHKGVVISNLAHDLMEGPVRMWEDQMIYKPLFDNQVVLAWHRDYTYWDHVGPAELGTCWIALDDATVENGCMHVVPGSHRWEYSYTRVDVDAEDPHWPLRTENVPDGADTTPVPCEVAAGHCHFHHCRLLHGSYGNKTDNPRRSYVLHLMPGNIRRIGESWNDRMATVDVPMGEIVRGPQYPELAAPRRSFKPPSTDQEFDG